MHPNTGETRLIRAELEALPGQFVSDEHEADCSRFLQEVKELIVTGAKPAGREC